MLVHNSAKIVHANECIIISGSMFLLLKVLVQGWHVTQDNLGSFLESVQHQLERLEDTVAEVTGIVYDQLEVLRVSNFVRQLCVV